MSRNRDIRIRSSDETAKKIKSETETLGEKQLLFGYWPLNTLTPCAACKLLRRRCVKHCPFSLYFFPHRFAAVHRVFGASNVSNMLMEVPESHRADGANSLVYEANLMLKDPVKGCMGVISALQRQIQSLQTQLYAVREEIFKYKNRDAAAQNLLPTPPPPAPSALSLPLSSSSACSIYKPEISAMVYSSISSDNAPYNLA